MSRGRAACLRGLSEVEGSVRVPRPHLFVPLLATTVPAPQHQSPAAHPAEADAGDARAWVRARSHEGARFRVNLGGGAHPRTQLGVGPVKAEGAVSATRSRPWARRCPKPAPSTRAVGVSGLQALLSFRVRAWRPELTALVRIGGSVVCVQRPKLPYLRMRSIQGWCRDR